MLMVFMFSFVSHEGIRNVELMLILKWKVLGGYFETFLNVVLSEGELHFS